jgi:NAD(P)-dependent dehydrogenase (short-subunit alcohol dehydrogenase family)
MTKKVVISGSASGIGAATAARLSRDGFSVFGIDRAGADCNVDLGTKAGRDSAVAAALAFSDGALDAPERAVTRDVGWRRAGGAGGVDTLGHAGFTVRSGKKKKRPPPWSGRGPDTEARIA